MSEKVTFQELIDSISEETDRSKQFTHDFMKGLVTVIHDGLEEDRNVNIAGFGKFDLREVDEREGYNPQTGEPMTIPAHNKVVFKPYKQLRERVNAPYTDREPRLIGDREEDTTKQQADFIPTAPPTRVDSRSGEDGSGEGGQDAPLPGPSPQSDTSGDTDSSVVEYAPGMEKGKSTQPPSDKEVSNSEKEKFKQWRAAAEGEPEDRFGFRKSRRHERSDANWMLITAAAIVILLIAAAAYMWTFNSLGNGEVGPQQTGQLTEVEDPQDPSRSEDAAATQNNSENQQQPAADRPETAASSGETNSGGAGDDTPASTAAGAASLNEITGNNETVSRRVESGQTLWSMARQEYDDPYLWPWIYGTNHSDIEDPDLIQAGASLAVPLPEGPRRTLSLSDSLQVAMGYVESYQWYRGQNSEQAKYYLYAATRYHDEVLEHTDIEIDQEDLAFATRPR